MALLTPWLGLEPQLWAAARAYVAEVLLEGIARAGVKNKCTAMGRSAMSLDLQVTATSCD